MMLACRKPAVIIAHPDDETLGMGGTIPLIARNGGSVTVIRVTDGISAQQHDEAMKERRNRGFERACEILGVHRIQELDFPDMRLDTVPHVELNERLSDVISRAGHDVVFCHHSGDVNMDHRRVHHSVLVCTRPTPGQPVKAVVSFYVASSTEWSFSQQDAFTPSLLVDITETIGLKVDAMNAYVDEVREEPHPRSEASIRATAQHWGNAVGVAYAEPFKILRWLW